MLRFSWDNNWLHCFRPPQFCLLVYNPSNYRYTYYHLTKPSYFMLCQCHKKQSFAGSTQLLNVGFIFLTKMAILESPRYISLLICCLFYWTTVFWEPILHTVPVLSHTMPRPQRIFQKHMAEIWQWKIPHLQLNFPKRLPFQKGDVPRFSHNFPHFFH